MFILNIYRLFNFIQKYYLTPIFISSIKKDRLEPVIKTRLNSSKLTSLYFMI